MLPAGKVEAVGRYLTAMGKLQNPARQHCHQSSLDCEQLSQTQVGALHFANANCRFRR